ncbi:MAG: CDP-alcohol phosphatidyltransferase family protein [Rhizobiaceae bacterium]
MGGLEDRRLKRRRRLPAIPLKLFVPNLITVLAICAGLSGVRMALEGRIDIAVMLVLVAALLDAVDGKVARLLKATSPFGAQMDSLADIVNFGVAPALVLYIFVLEKAGALGWTAALIYAIACALRLARFNIMLDDPDRPVWKNDFFVGVPAPAGAILVMLPIYLGLLGIELDTGFALFAGLYVVLVAMLLISQLPVYSGKASGPRVRRDLVMPLMLLIVFYVALLASFTWVTLTLSVLAFMAFLPFSYRAYRRREAKAAAAAPKAD